MAAMTLDLEIYLEGRDEGLVVRADQRDMAAFEREYKMGTQAGMENLTMTFFRYVGWAAARRLGKIDQGFDEFDKVAISVEPPDEEEIETPDPTNPAA